MKDLIYSVKVTNCGDVMYDSMETYSKVSGKMFFGSLKSAINECRDYIRNLENIKLEDLYVGEVVGEREMYVMDTIWSFIIKTEDAEYMCYVYGHFINNREDN